MRNEVHLEGEVCHVFDFRRFPSGDGVFTFRILLNYGIGHPDGRVYVTIEVRGEGARELRDLKIGEVVEIRGALRQEVWRDTQHGDLRRILKVLASAVERVPVLA